MIVRNRRRFVLGVVGLVTFFAVLTVWLSPVINGMRGLDWADNFFNRLSKAASYKLPELRKKAEGFRGKAFEVAVVIRGDKAARPDGQAAEDSKQAARVGEFLRSRLAGAEVSVDGSELRVRGDLGVASLALMDDAEPVYADREDGFEQKHGMGGHEALYWYWMVFGEVYKYYMAKPDVETANFASSMRTKICEPIYNFRGIHPTKASEASGQLVFLLAFYVAYTIWFGFSILFLFEGMGIGAHKGKKQEV